MIRIAVNSSPRSGHAWLQFLILESLNESKNVRLGEIGDGNFVIRSNVPLMLLGKFDDVIQTPILRSPLDIIPSIITKTMGGIGNVVSAGVTMPPETNRSMSISHHLDAQYYVYEAWCYGIQNNINNLLPFTFEQVTTNIEFVLSEIFNKVDEPTKHFKNSDIEMLLKIAKDKIRQHDKGHIGYNNAIPIQTKPDIYYEIKDELNNFDKLDQLMSMYLDCKEKIEKYHNA